MKTQVHAERVLTEYAEQFARLARQYDGTAHHSEVLEGTINQYAAFITSDANRGIWEELHQSESEDRNRLIADLRAYSARCVAIMEKIRALKLLNGQTERTDYFDNIESCIEEEFGGFRLTATSNVLMIGSGSFPMTPLYIAKRTGASVVGIDIDDEAIELGQRVVERLGGGLPITLTKAFVENLPYTQQATHIIFSSTIENKYRLLDQLHDLTNDRVVVAMRFGDRLKSLFNYPKQETDERKWNLAEVIMRPEQVFDIALYTKGSRGGANEQL
ncbi:class I SAM-dependent methyltransferase [Paenibacillus methanolicus]|uniref:Nicotianamine synthase-like protein n=1 Tax=Paenibacillus methanolicus TaxID=582686 RepID=A0A5S5CB79_9BACL|nr:class I SAM-dependent methyltransferase [Paenibacillus methanolicus]TYP76419.1 hypothetical protein BCM02_10380 [Paenibacillus methanolicus]